MTIEQELREVIDWHYPPTIIINGKPEPMPRFYKDEAGELRILVYKLPEEKQKIVDSIVFNDSRGNPLPAVRFMAPISCTEEERFYADFQLANKIPSNRQWKQTVLNRASEWRDVLERERRKVFDKEALKWRDAIDRRMKRANLARRIYKRIINWFKGE